MDQLMEKLLGPMMDTGEFAESLQVRCWEAADDQWALRAGLPPSQAACAPCLHPKPRTSPQPRSS
jgi:hypothetical protein